ncbi:hypothetical protein, partial [Herbaspirillum sp. alder98]|uniref:hypothetical protein n=1 Tax=Herbaspirillum sp. alder98 TaxID=2913096 RepID=UPI001CD8A1DD
DAQAVNGKYLTEKEVREKYRTCEDGWYSGPQPGKARFTRDPWLWVVTPEFAQRFCLPAGFVSEDLKGAEAVAFRLKRNDDEVGCGLAGNPDACVGETVMRFEVYVKSDAPIPTKIKLRFFQLAHLPSSMLISDSQASVKQAKKERDQYPQDLGVVWPLDPTQVALLGIQNSRAEWPIATLYPETYFARVFPGIDYYAFEGSSGFFRNPRMEKIGIRKFVIAFAKPGANESNLNKAISKFPYVIEIPEWYSDKIAEIDRNKGFNASQTV